MPDASDPRLLLLIQRIERLMAERDGITDDIRGVFSEAKADGYDTKMMRRLIARRAMNPNDRATADEMLQVYEAAIGMGGGDGCEDLPSIADLKPDAAALAAAMLTEQVAGLDDPDQSRALVDHVLFPPPPRAEIAELRLRERPRKKLAEGEGFFAKQIADTVRWFEKVAKHGIDAMKAGEATFRLYRSTVDRHQRLDPQVSGDPKLQAHFGQTGKAEAKTNRRTKAAADAAALAQAAKLARGEG